MYPAGRATYIETVIVAEEELELGGEVAQGTGHDTKENGGSWDGQASISMVNTP